MSDLQKETADMENISENTTEKATAEEVAEIAAEETAETTAAEAASEEITSEDTAEAAPEETAEETSEETAEETSEETAEETSEETAEETSEETAEETSEEKPKKKVDLVSSIIRILVVAFFFFALGMLCNVLYGYLSDVEENKQIKEMVIEEEEEKIPERPNRATPKYPGIMKPKANYPKRITKEKLQLLKSKNPDFRLWFYIEKTDIDYPVMFTTDNNKYLKTDFYNQPNVSGTLFMDYRNNEIKQNTIIYGHNMRNGTMFGELKNYHDEVYFKQHRNIYTYSEDEVIEWKVFSAYETNIYNNYIKTAFADENAYMKFLKKVQDDSMYKTDIELKSTDTILTLSTCRNGEGNNGRFVVHAVRVNSFPMT